MLQERRKTAKAQLQKQVDKVMAQRLQYCNQMFITDPNKIQSCFSETDSKIKKIIDSDLQ